MGNPCDALKNNLSYLCAAANTALVEIDDLHQVEAAVLRAEAYLGNVQKALEQLRKVSK